MKTEMNRKCPCVFRDEMTIKVDLGGVAFSMRARDYKSPMCVVIADDNICEEEKCDEQG